MVEEKDNEYFKQFTDLKKLNEGTFAVAYLMSDGRVLRHSQTELDGFMILAQLKDFEAKEFGILKIFSFDSEWSEYAITERLYHLDVDTFSDVFEHVSTHFNEIVESDNYEALEEIIKHEHKELKELLIKAFNLGRFLIDGGYRFLMDIKRDNIMARKNGELVLSDPIGCLDI